MHFFVSISNRKTFSNLQGWTLYNVSGHLNGTQWHLQNAATLEHTLSNHEKTLFTLKESGIIDHKEMTQNSNLQICAYLSPILTVSILLIWLGLIWYRESSHKPILVTTDNPAYVSSDVTDEGRAERNIIFIRRLCNPRSAVIYEGILLRSNVRCALKAVPTNSSTVDTLQLVHEAHLMRNLRAHHVIEFFDTAIIGGRFFIIMEYMINSDLRQFLRAHNSRLFNSGKVAKVETIMSEQTMIRMAVEIADGMAYIASKKIVHCDLAARNCLVADNLTVKIADFGLSMQVGEIGGIYRPTETLQLPIRWMAPESIKECAFSSASDIWSYAIVLWEIFTLGETPFGELSISEVKQYVKEGKLLERPALCLNNIYTLMVQMWNRDRLARPNFCEIIGKLVKNYAFETGFKQLVFFTIRDQSQIPRKFLPFLARFIR